jgi:hypothetical protein
MLQNFQRAHLGLLEDQFAHHPYSSSRPWIGCEDKLQVAGDSAFGKPHSKGFGHVISIFIVERKGTKSVKRSDRVFRAIVGCWSIAVHKRHGHELSIRAHVWHSRGELHLQGGITLLEVGYQAETQGGCATG